MSALLDDAAIRALTGQYGTPLFLLDCKTIESQYQSLKQALPGVDFYYAVKALPHDAVIRTLEHCGAGFDIASSGEIELLRRRYINPRATIHTHPVKKARDIRESLRFGCTTFVVDNRAELKKFYAFRHRVGLLLRVSFPNPDAVVDLSQKFGCLPEEALELLHLARKLGMHVKGLSFHVGSQSKTSAMHVHAIERCRAIMEEYATQADDPLSTLDIGGGFPVRYCEAVPDIEAFCAPINAALRKLDDCIHVIAEPGRYLVAAAAMSITSVTGKAVRNGRNWYYMDDGVYGVYSGQIFDHADYPVRSLRQGKLYPSCLAGPTCDSIDIVKKDIDLPIMAPGDLIVGEMMGAYTAATSTDFNSLARSRIIVLNEPDVSSNVAHIA
ncbi:MAG: type III PLP-dependent enzyme [Gammaproteobacteria bacterium]|jgi:ornithine decarboxylase|nr:MAG: type III PLP-dependent enzyme [Gammaproteobacteria bacterium]